MNKCLEKIPQDIIEEAICLAIEDGMDPFYLNYDESIDGISNTYPVYVNYFNDHWYSIFFNCFDGRG